MIARHINIFNFITGKNINIICSLLQVLYRYNELLNIPYYFVIWSEKNLQ